MQSQLAAHLRGQCSPARRGRALARVAMLGILLAAHSAFADALTPVTNASTIFRDTIVAICLTFMTGAWGYAGMKIGLSGANVRDMGGPFIGGAIAGGAALMAGAFIG